MDFDEAVRMIRLKDPRYQPQAYEVVRQGLDHAQKIEQTGFLHSPRHSADSAAGAPTVAEADSRLAETGGSPWG